MENERLEQYRSAVRQILARRGWQLVQDEEAFMGEVFTDVERRLRLMAPKNRRPLAKVIEDATINRYGHIWHAACAASGTQRQDQAFRELRQDLLRVALRVAHNHETLAEESVQEALINISKNLSKMDDPGRFLRWVHVIVSREANKRWKRAWNRPETPEVDLARSDDPDAGQSTLEGLMSSDSPPPSETGDLRTELEEVIKHCLKRSKNGAEVMIRLLLDDQSVQQVADEQGMKPINIYRIIYRAKKTLCKCSAFNAFVKKYHLTDATLAKGESA